MRRLERGDRGVVVLVAQLFDGTGVPSPPLEWRRRQRWVDLRKARCGQCDADLPARRGGHGHVGPGVADEPDLARAHGTVRDAHLVGRHCGPRRREDDVVELQVRGAAIAELGHRELPGERDVLRSRAVEQRRLTIAFELAQHACAGRGQQRRIHATRGEHDAVPTVDELGGQFDGVVGQSDDQNVLVDAGIESIDVDAVAVGHRNRRLPVGGVVAISDEHRAGPIGEPVGRDDEMVIGEIDRVHGLAEADVELVGSDQVGQRHASVGLDDPNAFEAGAQRGDGDRQTAGRAADDDEVVERQVG